MKKMERLHGPLFRPLTATEQVRVTAGITTETLISIAQTHTSAGVVDVVRDGDNE
jgi:hypothetical protein